LTVGDSEQGKGWEDTSEKSKNKRNPVPSIKNPSDINREKKSLNLNINGRKRASVSLKRGEGRTERAGVCYQRGFWGFLLKRYQGLAQSGRKAFQHDERRGDRLNSERGGKGRKRGKINLLNKPTVRGLAEKTLDIVRQKNGIKRGEEDSMESSRYVVSQGPPGATHNAHGTGHPLMKYSQKL